SDNPGGVNAGGGGTLADGRACACNIECRNGRSRAVSGSAHVLLLRECPWGKKQTDAKNRDANQSAPARTRRKSQTRQHWRRLLRFYLLRSFGLDCRAGSKRKFLVGHCLLLW